MGIRAGVATSITSFLLGALFVHWVADSLTLWKQPVTDEHLWTAATYYSILAQCRPEIWYILAALATLGGSTFLWSLNDREAENIMFDGGSICEFSSRALDSKCTHMFCQVLFATVLYVNLNSALPSAYTSLLSSQDET